MKKTIPFHCLVCVFKDSWEVSIVQDSSFLHLTKVQDKHFLLSLRKGTPCCPSSGAEDLGIAQQASSYPTLGLLQLQSHGSAKAFQKAYDREIKGDAEP